MKLDDRSEFTVEKTTIRNRRVRSITLVLEPWGERRRLLPGASVQLVAKGPLGGKLEISWKNDTVSVFAWSGASITIQRNGKPVKPSRKPAVPRSTAPWIPQGMSMKEWADAMKNAV